MIGADERTLQFEEKLSDFVANSGLSADQTLMAVGVMMARILFGVETLYDKSTALVACGLFDRTICLMWDRLKQNEDVSIH